MERNLPRQVSIKPLVAECCGNGATLNDWTLYQSSMSRQPPVVTSSVIGKKGVSVDGPLRNIQYSLAISEVWDLMTRRAQGL